MVRVSSPRLKIVSKSEVLENTEVFAKVKSPLPCIYPHQPTFPLPFSPPSNLALPLPCEFVMIPARVCMVDGRDARLDSCTVRRGRTDIVCMTSGCVGLGLDMSAPGIIGSTVAR